MPKWLQWHYLPIIISISALTGMLIILFQPGISRYSLPSENWLNANHFIITVIVLLAGFGMINLIEKKYRTWIVGLILAASVSGLLMLLNIEMLISLTRISYTIFDLIVAFIVIIFVYTFIYRIGSKILDT